MNIKADLKKRILSKIEEGYNEGGRLVEMGEVSLYPEPAPAVDPTVIGSGKTLQVDSDLLRDLLNWATSADAGSIDAVVAKAEEMGVGAPLSPAQLIDLTATANTADPSNPSVACGVSDATQGITSPVVPAGPVGPLSPVMASFMRRGNKVEELASLPGMDKAGAIQVKTDKKPGNPAPLSPKVTAQLARAQKKAVASGQNPGEMTLYGNEADEHEEVSEDDIIDSDNEVITDPEQMGDKNDGINDIGGGKLPSSTRPIGKLNDPALFGAAGLEEDGDDVEGIAGAIADGIADGISGDGMETEPEVNALPGEGIPSDDDDAAINAGFGEPVAPPMGDEGGEGLVGQVASLQARVAELEALLSGSVGSEAPEAEIEIGGEAGEEDELSIDGDNAEDEDSEDSEDDDTEDGEDDEDTEDSDDEDDAGEEEEDDEKLLLGGEEEEKEEK